MSVLLSRMRSSRKKIHKHCILYCGSTYAIMPIGKKIVLFHSEQQRKTLGGLSEGFSIPIFGAERLKSTG